MNEQKTNTKELGHYFDLDQTAKAYELGGNTTHWSDYTHDWYNKLSAEEQLRDENLDNAWDVDAYYAACEEWWDHLTESKRLEIIKAMR